MWAARSGVIGRGHLSGSPRVADKGLSVASLAAGMGMTRFRSETDKHR